MRQLRTIKAFLYPLSYYTVIINLISLRRSRVFEEFLLVEVENVPAASTKVSKNDQKSCCCWNEIDSKFLLISNDLFLHRNMRSSFTVSQLELKLDLLYTQS